MDFSLTEDQQLICDTAKRLLAAHCPTSLLRAHQEDRAAADPLWEQLRSFAALGGGDCTDICLFLDELGYVSAPGPFLASVALFAPLLAAGDDPELNALFHGTLDGTIVGTVAICGAAGIPQPNDEPRKFFVADADLATHLAIVDVEPGGVPTLRVVAADGVELTPITTMDSTRSMFVIVARAGADDVVEPRPLDDSVLAAWVDRADASVAAETVGTARRLFDMALQYAKERVQFDRPIGSFQAIQHKLADMSLALERATAAVQYAAMTVDADDPERARACHSAKAASADAAHRIIKDSIQIHGGIGYTWEHDLQLFLRRATFAETFLGTATWHHDRIADLLFG